MARRCFCVDSCGLYASIGCSKGSYADQQKSFNVRSSGRKYTTRRFVKALSFWTPADLVLLLRIRHSQGRISGPYSQSSPTTVSLIFRQRDVGAAALALTLHCRQYIFSHPLCCVRHAQRKAFRWQGTYTPLEAGPCCLGSWSSWRTSRQPSRYCAR